MSDNDIRVVCIKPNDIPKLDYIKNDLLCLNKLVNIDKYGNECPDFESFKIVEIKDNINIISSPKSEERELPLVRKVGRFQEFYGVMYIVKMDSNFNFVSMSYDEAVDYGIKFLPDEISVEDLGLDVDYGDNQYSAEDDKDDGNRRIEIWCDDW